MSNDAFVKWLESKDEINLHEKFLEQEKLKDKFESYCFEKWQEETADKSDYLYECERDRKMEQEEQTKELEEEMKKILPSDVKEIFFGETK